MLTLTLAIRYVPMSSILIRWSKDHRTGYETANTTAVLDGQIDELIEAYLRFGPIGKGYFLKWSKPFIVLHNQSRS
jgi:hypothetical protein